MKHSIITCEVCKRKLADLIKVDSANIYIDMAICDSCEKQEIALAIKRSEKWKPSTNQDLR